MRKLVLTVALFTLVLGVSSIATTEVVVAAGLAPYSCVTAADYGWTHYGLNRACLWDLQDNCCDPIGDPWY